jgi:hypothetical protein
MTNSSSNNTSSSSSSSASSDSVGGPWKPFVSKAERFILKTQEHALQGLNPGGVYQAIWCRDASYILRDWFLSGNISAALQQIYLIWSHQISPNREKVIYGRGSPEMDFLPEVANADKEKEFEGALPTTIYQAGFSEIYGQNPDIDSIGLMVSTTSWILARITLKDRQREGAAESEKRSSQAAATITASESSSDYVSALLSKAGITDPSKVTEFAVPRMLGAIEYLNRRDIDNDGLLEQNHNEDWMDTTIRAGKILYSQACWLLALNDLSALMSKLGRNDEANRLRKLADKTIHAVEEKLWSEEAGCYMDIEESHHTDGRYRMVTQDVCLYLIAITENTSNDSFTLHQSNNSGNNNKQKKIKQQPQEQELNSIHQNLYNRASKSLDTIKNKVWKDKWPLVTEGELKKTAPWVLKPYQYHNHTCWPWITGLEMLARSRFNQFEECDFLLSKLTSEDHPHIHTFYEWINPTTDEGGGAYPFRTGISTVRIAIADIVEKIKRSQ